MHMQRFILSMKKEITFISAVLITLYFLTKTNYFLIIASVIALLPILIQAVNALRLKIVSIELLVSIAVIAAFLINNYEESAIVSFLFLFGALLEQKTLSKTRNAIKELIDMAPETALLIENEELKQITVNEVKEKDLLLVRTGDKVPVDAYVVEGSAYLDESMITGESFSESKEVNSFVYAGSIAENGLIKIRAEKIGKESTFSKIIELVEEAQDSKSKTEKFIDRFSRVYTPAVLLLSIIVFFTSRDLELTITIMVLACPGALVIGVPISNVAGIGKGAKEGVLIKGSEVSHKFTRVDVMVFDKTGTLTKGKPIVSTVRILDDQALDYLYSIEKESDHPLAQAVVHKLDVKSSKKIEKTKVIKGKGIFARSGDNEILVGNLALMKMHDIKINKEDYKFIKEIEAKGHSLVLTAMNSKLAVIMGIEDEIREDAKEIIIKLRKLGIKEIIILSGDNQGSVDYVAKQVGIKTAFGGMLPQDKSNYIENLQDKGHMVAFIGDGINDSPSLALADIGIAMGAGTDVAIETSDIVLMNSDITKLPHAYKLSKIITANMMQNMMIALGVVVFLILNVLLSPWMNMSLGMLIHEGSILLVIFNGMRILNKKIKT